MAQTKITRDEVSLAFRQSGWNYVTIPSTGNFFTLALTFPTAFSAPPKVFVTPLGYKTGAAPASIADFTGSYSGGSTLPFLYITNITATGCTVNLAAPSGTTFGVSYNGFTWIAEA